MHKTTSLDDTDAIMILENAADADASFSQLIGSFHKVYPALKIHELYKIVTGKLEKLLHEQLLEVVKIKYHHWDDTVQLEHLSISNSLLLIHIPSTWDRESESNDEVYRLWATDTGLALLIT